MTEVTKRDENLLNKLESAICFGKIIFFPKAVLTGFQKLHEKNLQTSYRAEYKLREEAKELEELNRDGKQQVNFKA